MSGLTGSSALVSLGKSGRASQSGFPVCLILAGILLTLPIPVEAQINAGSVFGDSDCLTVSIGSQFRWLTGSIWSPERSAFLVSDPFRDGIFEISPKGVVERVPISPTDKNKEGHLLPASIVRTGSGYVVSRAGGEPSLLLDSDFVTEKVVQLRQDIGLSQEARMNLAQKNEPLLGSLYSGWIISSGGFLYGYGAVGKQTPQMVEKQLPGKYELGLIRARYEASTGKVSGVNLLLPLSDNKYYTVGFHPLAEVNQDVYFLVLQNDTGKASIYRVPDDGTSRPVETKLLPVEFRNITHLKTKVVGPASAEALFDELETAHVPVGIFGDQDGNLLLLARKPGNLGADWLIYSLLAYEDGSGPPQAVVLPTNARHLSVVQMIDEGRLGFLERGRVSMNGEQTIGPIKVMRTRALFGRDSGRIECRVLRN